MHVLSDRREQADAWIAERGNEPVSRAGAVLVVMPWIAIGTAPWAWLVLPRL